MRTARGGETFSLNIPLLIMNGLFSRKAGKGTSDLALVARRSYRFALVSVTGTGGGGRGERSGGERQERRGRGEAESERDKIVSRVLGR